MATFVERVHSFPIVRDSCETISGIYNSSKQKNEKVGYICGIAENVAGNVVSRVKTMADNPVVSKVDSLACDYVLDPLEKKAVQLHYPSEQLLGPWADYAVGKMEYVADFFLPAEEQQLQNMDRQMRLVRLKDRIQTQVGSQLSKIVAEVQHLFSMLAENVEVAVIKQKLEYIFQLLNSKFRALVGYFNGPAIEQNLVYLRDLLSKLLEDLKSGKVRELLSLAKVHEVLEKLQAQLHAIQSNGKKVRTEKRPEHEESFEVAEVKIIQIPPSSASNHPPHNESGINEDQLALNESLDRTANSSSNQLDLGSFFQDPNPDTGSLSGSSSEAESFETQSKTWRRIGLSTHHQFV